MRSTNLLLMALAWLVAGSLEQSLAAGEPTADPSCASVNELLSASTGGFVSLRGDREDASTHAWNANKAFSGGKSCLVFGGNPSAYTCTLYAGDDDERAEGVFEDTVSRLTKCLPSGWTSKKQVDSLHSEAIFSANPPGASIRVVSRIGSVDAYFVEFWIEAARK